MARIQLVDQVFDPLDRRVLARFRLSDAEREALLAGDVATLERMGAHGYLLANLGRFGLLGLDRESYARRIKGLR